MIYNFFAHVSFKAGKCSTVIASLDYSGISLSPCRTVLSDIRVQGCCNSAKLPKMH